MRDKFKMIRFLIPALVALAIGIWIPLNNPVPVEQRDSVRGEMDLQGWDGRSVVELHGEWQYYDGILSSSIQKVKYPEYQKVPHFFSTPYGVGTYRLHLKNLDPKQFYAVQVMDISSAYRFIINGQEVIRAGVVS